MSIKVPLKFIFVFDDSVDIKEITRLEFPEESEVVLFPLSGDWRLIRQVEALVRLHKGTRAILLNAANMVELKAEALCRTIPDWSARCGSFRIGRKTIREHFLLPDGGPSTFWFGPLSEKNPLKTDSFLSLAQAQAVEEEIQGSDYDAMITAVSSDLLCESFKRIAGGEGIEFYGNHTSSRPVTTRARSGIGWVIIRAAGGWVQIVFRALMARFVMGATSRRFPDSDSLFFVTYFPYLDKQAAAEGKFRNKYFEPLQDILEAKGKSIFWILVFVYIDGGSFRDSLKTARKMARMGEKIIFLEEFLGVKEIFVGFFLWLAQIVKYLFLEKKFDDEMLCGGTLSPSCIPIIQDLWRRSFCGLEALRGLMNYLAFFKAFASIPQQKRCIYCCEMQGWEKAMISAGQRVRPEMETIGYQHTCVSRNYLFYVHSSSEVETSKMRDGLPLPRTLATNGRLAWESFRRCGYEGLIELEAIRYQAVSDILGRCYRPPGELPVLLLVGSIVSEETRALISMVHDSMPLNGQWEIWLKGHPSMPVDGILRDLAIDPDSVRWNIKEGDISSFLEKADIAMVPTSSVAVEALAYGCEVVVPASSSIFPMSPLAGFNHTYSAVHSPEELGAALDGYLRKGPKMDLEEKRSFVRNYWHLDSSLPRWKEILS